MPSLTPRRRRAAAVMLSAALLVTAAGIWSTPGLRWPGPGQTPEQIALQREQARADDLARQLDDANRRLRQPRPPQRDLVALARGDDLADQLAAAEAELSKPRPPDPGLLAAATRPRPPLPDHEALARARDLAAQNDRLEAELRRPRPIPDPLDGVRATLTRQQIIGARNLLGLYTAQSPFDYGEVDLVQGAVGRSANLVGYFQSWADPFDPRPLKLAWLRGQVPLLTWEPQRQVGIITADQPDFSLPRIIDGAHDDVIRAYARGIRDTGLPVVVRLAHEMNGTWYPWSERADHRDEPVNGNRPGDYARMWRHVHGIFAAEGANQHVIWLWSPNRINRICRQRPPAAFYPGDDVVDWVGMSGYFRDYAEPAGPCDDTAATFDAVFGGTLPLLREAAPNKPILLSEIGATEHGDAKPEFERSLFQGLAANPDVIGFAWFNLSVTAGVGNGRITHDWRINSSPASTRTMREALAAFGYGAPL